MAWAISPLAKIDWEFCNITAANGCDVSVSVPERYGIKRFTCNGVIFATDSHQKNISKILSSMNGNLVYSNGKYIVHAGIYEAPTETLTEDDLIGAISIRTSLERSDRFNTIKGLFIDPAQNHKSSEFPKVQLADAVTRDNNEILEKEVQYPMTNSSYMAQRLSNKLIQLSDQQKVVSFPANLSALRITAGDRVQVSVEELNWSNKVFQCVGWTFSEDGGVNLTLREDSSTSYADPAVNEYSTVTAIGSITDAFRGVPSPSGLTVTPGLKSNELNWVNPGKTNDFGTIYVYASRNANFSSAIKIGETDGTQFIHDGSNKSLIFFPSVVNVGDTYTIRTLGNTNFVAMGAASNTVGVVFTATATGSGTGNLWETLSPGDLRYYWVRAVKNVGTDDASRSGLEPPDDPNTTVFATVGAVEVDWDNVADPTIGIDINNDTISINTGVANTTTGQTVAKSGIEAGTTIAQGGITMNQGGSIKGGQSAYNSGTGFFLGYDTNAYKFSIGNSSTEALTFDGTNLAVTGAITATSGTFTGTVNASAGAFTGDVSTDSKFIAGSGATSATMDGGDQNYRIYAGGATPDLSSFKVDSDGVVTATRLVVTRPDDLSAVIFDSARDGLVGIGLASISQDTGIVVQAPSVELTSQTNTVSVVLTASQTLTLETILALPTAKKGAGNYTTAQYPESITATMEYSTNSGSSWSTFGAAVVLTRTATTSPSDTSKFGVLTAAIDGNGNTGYRRDVHAIDAINNIHFIKSVAGFAAGSYLFRVQLSFVAGSSPDTDYEPNITGNRTLQFGTDGAGFTVDEYGVITDSPSGTATIGYVQSNYVALNNGNTITVGSGETNTFEDESSNEILVVSDTEVVARNLFRATWNGAQPTSTKIIRVTNPTGTAERFSVTEAGNLTTTTLGVTGDATITGDLTVNGTTTTVNTDNLTVKDNNITLNYSTGDSSSTANNSGITIQDAVNLTTDASLLWKTATDRFEFSHAIYAPAATFTGNVETKIIDQYQEFAAGNGDHEVQYFSKVLATYSENYFSQTYIILTTTVPQSSLAMGGFQLTFWDKYSTSTSGDVIDIYGYFSPESNGGFAGFRYNSKNPNFEPTIQVGANSSGYTVFILSNFGTSSYAQLVAKDFWSGYTSTGAARSWGQGWSFSTSNSISAYNNLDTLGRNGVTSAQITNLSTAYNYSQVGHLPLAGGTLTGALSGTSGTFTGAITATGGTSTNWNTAYTYSQVGHLPLAGGTVSAQTFFLADVAWKVSGSDAAHQRADARDDATNFSRLHWYGVDYNLTTSNFRHAWYDGAAYINITAASGTVTFDGNIAATNVSVADDLKFTGTDNFIWSPNTTSGFVGFYDPNNNRVAAKYQNDTGGWGLLGEPASGYALKVHGAISSGSIESGAITSISAIGAADDVRTGLIHYDSTAMAAGVGGQLILGYKYLSTGEYTAGAILKTYKENATSNHYGSGLKFQVRNTGFGLSTKMTLNPSGNLSVTGGIQSFGPKTQTEYPDGILTITDTTAVATGVGGGILFSGKYSGSTVTTSGSIDTRKDNATAGQFWFFNGF